MPGDKPQVNFVIQLSEQHLASSRLTLNLAGIPFTEVLKYIGGLANLTFDYDKYAILVKAAGAAPVSKATPTAQ
jgi:hypothetical protein